MNSTDADGTTALMHSVIESDANMMKLLINAGANVNASNEAGSTALMYATTNLPKTRSLIAAGADVNAKNKRGAAPMNVAVLTYGSTPVLKLLIAKGARPEGRLMTPVAQKGDLEAIQYLLSIGVSAGEKGDSSALAGAVGSGCDACVQLLLAKGAPADGVTGGTGQGGILSQTARRGMPEMAQTLLDHGASLTATDRDGYTLLTQAVVSLQSPADGDRMVQWLLSKGVDPNAKSDRGETPWLLASRAGAVNAMALLAKAGAKQTEEEWPQPAAPASNARAAAERAIPLLEMTGEPMFTKRGCVSCHSNSLTAMTVALARQKGLTVNIAQAKKELGFAVATGQPYFEQMRLGTTIGGGTDTLGYTLMGMAAASYPADALTDSHIHYITIYQYPDGGWRTISYRPPSQYSAFTTTAVALQSMRLYPLPGRREEFEDRFARAKQWLLTNKAWSVEEHSMQLNALASAGASNEERAPYIKELKRMQDPDGSWRQTPQARSDAYATGEALYALHVSGGVSVQDPVYRKGVQWLLQNQLSDGSWFVPAKTTPSQPHLDTGFPHGASQFSSAAGSNWATQALLFTLPDRAVPTNAP